MWALAAGLLAWALAPSHASRALPPHHTLALTHSLLPRVCVPRPSPSPTVAIGPTAPLAVGSLWVVVSLPPTPLCNTTSITLPDAGSTCTVTVTTDGTAPTLVSSAYAHPLLLGVGVWRVAAAVWFSNGTQYGATVAATYTVQAAGGA